ncbi:hypothetical protein AAK967_03670 [Atopobiaceae bacterium 24-176]
MAKKNNRETRPDPDEVDRRVHEELEKIGASPVEHEPNLAEGDDIEMATVEEVLPPEQATPRELENELAAYLIDTAVRSVETENQRGRSIASYSSRLLIGIAVLAVVALAVAVPTILILAPGWEAVLMTALFTGVLVPLLVAFLLAVTAGAGSARMVKGVPADLFSTSISAPVKTKMELARRICSAEQERYEEASASHDRVAGALTAARILMLVAVGFFVVALVFLCVIMFVHVA